MAHLARYPQIALVKDNGDGSALFEITPTEINKGAIKDNFMTGKLAELKLKYQHPNDTAKRLFNYSSRFDYVPFNELERCYKFSAAVVMFGSLLRSSTFTKNTSWNDVINMAEQSSGPADLLQKEFIALVQQAKTLYLKVKKKKGGVAVW